MRPTQEERQSWDKMWKLLPTLYETLVRNYGFTALEQLRTPGALNGVTRDGVEIYGVPHYDAVRVDVSIPVDAREDITFFRASCGGKYSLTARETILVTPNDFIQGLETAVTIAERGRAVFHYNQDKII